MAKDGVVAKYSERIYGHLVDVHEMGPLALEGLSLSEMHGLHLQDHNKEECDHAYHEQ